MEDRNEKNSWMSVPQFGDWDQKHQMPDYSMDFSKIREMRKQNKKDFSRASLGNEEELFPNRHQPDQLHQQHTHHSPTLTDHVACLMSDPDLAISAMDKEEDTELLQLLHKSMKFQKNRGALSSL